MQLKVYQSKVLERFDTYLSVLREKKEDAEDFVEFQKSRGKPAELANYCSEAWDELNTQRLLPTIRDKKGNMHIAPYLSRYDGLKRSYPNACFKVPTAGGKTLLATAAVERLNTDYFESQTGFVLWVVPSDAIYRQTWKNLANREHPYRQMLERASGGRVKMLERADSFKPQDVSNYLCVMLLMLPAANRKSNERLRMFRDSGKFTPFFPDVDDYVGNNELLQKIINLETNDLGDGEGVIAGLSIKHSLGNTLRLIQPIIIIDEGHKAYSENARKTLNDFNPSFVLELSATPNAKKHLSNILVDIHGTDLKAEQMIKLPINVYNYQNADWQHTLAEAHAKREELEKLSSRLRAREGQFIRPIMILRVDRTGKEMRDGKNVHAEDAREYLIERLGVKPKHIRVKSATVDEIGNEDLLSEYSEARYIITKDALKEGWDCPFAYILTILSKITAPTAMTQLVGRILRQPETQETAITKLNQCYVYCFDQDVEEAVKSVRSGLEQEGMGDLSGDIRPGGGGPDPFEIRKVTIKRKKDHRGAKIFLPNVVHRAGKGYRPIDYDRDILGELDWSEFTYAKKSSFTPDDQDKLQQTIIRIEMAEKNGQWDLPYSQESFVDDGEGELDHPFLVRQLLEVIPNPWQASRIVDETMAALKKRGIPDERIYVNRLFLLREMKLDLQSQVYEASEVLFREKLSNGDIAFRLVSSGGKQINWELAQTLSFEVRDDEPLFKRKNGEELEKNLFEKLFSKDLNDLEKDVAWYLDSREAVSWWHRMVAKHDFHLQGWQRNKVYPDFLACLTSSDDGSVTFSVLETKGHHLKGNDDTTYKQNLLDLLSAAYSNALDAGEVEIDDQNQRLIFKILIEDTWRSELSALVS